MQHRYRVTKRQRQEWADSDTPVYRVTLTLLPSKPTTAEWWRRPGEISIVTTSPDEADGFRPGAEFVVVSTPATTEAKQP